MQIYNISKSRKNGILLNVKAPLRQHQSTLLLMPYIIRQSYNLSDHILSLKKLPQKLYSLTRPNIVDLIHSVSDSTVCTLCVHSFISALLDRIDTICYCSKPDVLSEPCTLCRMILLCIHVTWIRLLVLLCQIRVHVKMPKLAIL